MAAELGQEIPKPGQWPVDPQEDVPVSKDRIWVDGCFDFSHHGKILHGYPRFAIPS
jgi:ethanolamine-phosphate cytidylyltransferase